MEKPTRICSIDGCGKKHDARGWCQMHYRRWQVHGDPLESKPARIHHSTPQEALAARTKRVGDCLEWTGSVNSSGYGTMTINKSHALTHRYAWERANGAIPDGMVIDHVCHNKLCANVDHLRLVTVAENGQYRAGASACNPTGARNVTWRDDVSKYMVSLRIQGRNLHGGLFDTLEEARTRAAELREEHYGDYAGKG